MFGSRCGLGVGPLKCVLLLTPDVVPFCVSFPIRGGAVPGEDPACAALASLFLSSQPLEKRILHPSLGLSVFSLLFLLGSSPSLAVLHLPTFIHWRERDTYTGHGTGAHCGTNTGTPRQKNSRVAPRLQLAHNYMNTRHLVARQLEPCLCVARRRRRRLLLDTRHTRRTLSSLSMCVNWLPGRPIDARPFLLPQTL